MTSKLVEIARMAEPPEDKEVVKSEDWAFQGNETAIQAHGDVYLGHNSCRRPSHHFFLHNFFLQIGAEIKDGSETSYLHIRKAIEYFCSFSTALDSDLEITFTSGAILDEEGDPSLIENIDPNYLDTRLRRLLEMKTEFKNGIYLVKLPKYVSGLMEHPL